jgi:mannose-6-phosphate isomerase-like protein (cupin superfamily)
MPLKNDFERKREMRRYLFVLLVLAIGATMLPAQPAVDSELPGYFHLRSDQLRQFEHSLQPKLNQYKQAADELADFGSHTAWVAHREADGLAEIHERWADLMFVISGEATLLLGGKVLESQMGSPGELRGRQIVGGKKRAIRQGDVVQVPAGMPHQFLITNGGQITFFTMKIAK